MAASAHVLSPQEIPAPEAEAARLVQKADSYGRSKAIQCAADAAAEAVSICCTIYGPDHPATLHARAVELRWASELFAKSYWLRGKRWARGKRKDDAALLRQRWETLIGEYRRIYGTGHRKTLHMSRHYAYHIRQTRYQEGAGLGSFDLLRHVLVEMIAEAEHSLGSKDDFTLEMRWVLAEIGGISWRELEKQFRRELDSRHPMANGAWCKMCGKVVESFRLEESDFLGYDQMK